MTTALQIINRAAELIGYKDPDEALSGSEASNFLGVLNDMVDAWNTDRLFIVTTTTVNASVSASPVLVGAGQTLNTTRPIRIEAAWVRDSGVDYPIRLVTAAEYDAIADKSVTGTLPERAYYEPAVPNSSLYLWPVPSAAITLYVRVMSQLSSFADTSTDYTFAPGYKKALEYSLAEELMPGRSPLNQQVMAIAQNARRAIRKTNFEPVLLEESDVASVGAFNIVTGE